MATVVLGADVLRRVPIFAELSEAELRVIAERAKLVHHEPGQTLLAENHEGIGLHVIVHGRAEVSRANTPRRTLGPGDYFGEIAMIDGRPRTMSVRAETELDALVLPAWEFRALMVEHPTIPRALLVALCHRLRALESGALLD